MLTLHAPHAAAGEVYSALTKPAPPVAVTALSFAGVGLQDWVYILTAIYTLVQLALVAPKLVRAVRSWLG
jgi:hypothetical protein